MVEWLEMLGDGAQNQRKVSRSRPDFAIHPTTGIFFLNPPGNRFFVVVALLFYVHGKHLRSCRDGQLT